MFWHTQRLAQYTFWIKWKFEALYVTVWHNRNFIHFIQCLTNTLHAFGLTETNIRYINTKNTHMEKISSKYISRKGAPYFYNCCHVQTFHTVIEYVWKTQNYVKIISWYIIATYLPHVLQKKGKSCALASVGNRTPVLRPSIRTYFLGLLAKLAGRNERKPDYK